MLLWIPVENDNGMDATISPQFEAKKWALVDFDAGEVKTLKFYDSREELGGEWVDFVIFINKFENYMDFMNEGMMCLVVREEKSIEEIITAFKFKELDEIGL